MKNHLQIFPIEEKVYAAINPNTVQMIVDGINAAVSSAKKATPLGSDKTPAPMIDFAKLKIDVETDASPPIFAFSATSTSLALAVVVWRGVWCLVKDRYPPILFTDGA